MGIFDIYFSSQGLSYSSCGATGIDDLTLDEQNFISFYPNPFSIERTLLTDKNLKEANLTVYNTLGQ